MDPLSVTASIVGLLGAGASITKFLNSIYEGPSFAKSVTLEVADISALLSHLQTYISGAAQASVQRQSLILLEHVLTTLTGCVLTYSELEAILAGHRVNSDRLKWVWQESKIVALVQRLQSHKSSLTLILNILQCQSLQQAETFNRELHALVAEVLRSNQDLAARIKGLEREGSLISKGEAGSNQIEGGSLITQRRTSYGFLHQDSADESPKFTFEQELETSRVYNRAGNRHSLSSATSAALHNTALSVFSSLSLSEISNISLYAIPIYAADLTTSQYYVFGTGGVANAIDRPRREKLSQLGWSPDLRSLPASRRRVLKQFTRRSISAPILPVHITHVELDNKSGQFTGLPKEWDHLLRTPTPVRSVHNLQDRKLPPPSESSSQDLSKNTKSLEADADDWTEADALAEDFEEQAERDLIIDPQSPQLVEEAFASPRDPPAPSGSRPKSPSKDLEWYMQGHL